jgi:tetratricopeptide (TPR) repeat protein
LTAGYFVSHLDEIAEVDDGRIPWRPIRHHFGITSFGINAWTAREAGERIINEHEEEEPDGHEELYFVTRGRASFEIDGERVDAPAGTFVFVQPGLKRTAFGEEPGTTVLVVGGAAGKAYEAVGWEVWAPLRPLYEAGEYDTVVERARELVAANPDYSLPLYNLACCESLAGRKTEALEHLRQAIERSEMFRSYAKGDSDFDPIREEPAFKELVGG